LLAYFNEEDFPSYDVQSLLNGYNFQSNTIPEQNWNEEWEQNFQPVVVDDFCAVRAHFHAPISTVKHEIIITPKMSFGTGHHATTYMMMQQMQNIDFNNKSVFDFGTGTGILAILAEKCGAKEIIAIDNDEWSYKNAEENLEMNSVKKLYSKYIIITCKRI
jgi:ribosomal protein L11 methyltransferase